MARMYDEMEQLLSREKDQLQEMVSVSLMHYFSIAYLSWWSIESDGKHLVSRM